MLRDLFVVAFEAVVAFFLGRRRDDQVRADARDGAVAEAATETQITVTEVADEQARAAVGGPDGVDALSAELRVRAARLATAGGGGHAGRV